MTVEGSYWLQMTLNSLLTVRKLQMTIGNFLMVQIGHILVLSFETKLSRSLTPLGSHDNTSEIYCVIRWYNNLVALIWPESTEEGVTGNEIAALSWGSKEPRRGAPGYGIRYLHERFIVRKWQYSRASHSANFGDKENQCISKTVYCELLYRGIKKTVYLQNFCIHFILWNQCTSNFWN